MLLPNDTLNPFTAFTTSGSSYLLPRALTEINDNFFQKVNKQFFASFSFLDSGDQTWSLPMPSECSVTALHTVLRAGGSILFIFN